MLILDINLEKTLVFEIEINGVGCDEMSGSVRFLYEGIEYGFPASIEEGKITSVIKPLKEVFPNIRNGTVVNAKLELNTETYYFIPWEDDIKVQAPVSVEAKIVDDVGVKSSSAPSVTVKPRGGRKPITEIKEVTKSSKKRVSKQTLESLTESQVYKLMERLGTTSPKIKEILYDQASSQAKSGKPADVLKEIIKIMGKRKSLKRSRM